MIRFKVVKASHLLLVAAAIILLAVLAVIFVHALFSSGESTPVSADNFVLEQTENEAKAFVAFASHPSQPSSLHIEILPDAQAIDSETAARSILIYHTHTHEAYSQQQEDPYEAVETWRTTDSAHSVVRVGSALADELTRLGYRVIHDTTDHEQDDINNAYLRSLETMDLYDEQFDLRVDLHRDAFSDGLKSFVTNDESGKEYAQIMLLVGRGDEYEAEERPPYEANLSFAQKLTNAMNARIPDICRNVTVKKGRYNQHADVRCILVEVGHNLNTLQQALNSVPCLAYAINETLKKYN